MVEFRPATSADLSGILALLRELNPEDPELAPSESAGIWTEILGNPRIRYLVAVDSGKVVGTCHVLVVPNLTRSGRPYALVENVVVDGAHRRRGIGRSLMDLAVDFAKSMHCYKVMIQSSAKRSEAHAFYQDLGFDCEAKRSFVLQLPD
jgi:GNAT superfamily N-acetyltransferase